jgi:hypothetical protein
VGDNPSARAPGHADGTGFVAGGTCRPMIVLSSAARTTVVEVP